MVQSFVADLLENLEEIGRIREFDLKRDRLVQMSCKRAIKGGDRLSDAELNDLLDQIQDEAIRSTCPPAAHPHEDDQTRAGKEIQAHPMSEKQKILILTAPRPRARRPFP
jgi:DNA mismatch repair ATPase MutL